MPRTKINKFQAGRFGVACGRADRQAKIAEAGTMLGNRGVVIGHARPPAARRELADIGDILEATIRFSGVENEGTRK